MTGTTQLPTDYVKYLDQTLYHYTRKKSDRIRGLFNQIKGDPADKTYEYVKMTQSYAATTGFTAFGDPEGLADGARPQLDGIGTEDATGTAVSYADGHRILRKLANSNKPISKNLVQQHMVEAVERVKVKINNSLITNMLSNASQAYAASNTWATTGDPFADLTSAKEAFYDQAGGLDADFLILHPNELADLKNDSRMQSGDYTSAKPIDTGTYTTNPLGLEIIRDTACTTGSFVLGKKGMFGAMFVTEDFVSKTTEEGVAGTAYEFVYTYIDIYQLPYLLMSGTGI